MAISPTIPLNSNQQSLMKDFQKESKLSTCLAYALSRNVIRQVTDIQTPAAQDTIQKHKWTLCTIGTIVGRIHSGGAACFGMTVGGSLGAVTGRLATYIDNFNEVFNSQAYQNWVTLRREINEKAQIKRFFNEDDLLKHFLCPILQSLPLIPVEPTEIPPAEFGKHLVFDLNTLLEWRRTENAALSLVPYPKAPPCPNNQVRRFFRLSFSFSYANALEERVRSIKRMIRAIPDELTNAIEKRNPNPINPELIFLLQNHDNVRDIVRSYVGIDDPIASLNSSYKNLYRIDSACSQILTKVAKGKKRKFIEGSDVIHRAANRRRADGRAMGEEFDPVAVHELEIELIGQLQRSARLVKQVVVTDGPVTQFFKNLFGISLNTFHVDSVTRAQDPEDTTHPLFVEVEDEKKEEVNLSL